MLGQHITHRARTGGEPDIDWSALRELMPVTRRWAYLDHAAVAPLPGPTRQAMGEWLDQATEDGDVRWHQWTAQIEQVRQSAGRLIGADDDEIALVPNTSFGINAVAGGLRWQPGDNVVIPAGEFPSNLFPWLNLRQRGVEVRIVPLDQGRVDLVQLDRACDDRTRLVSASWIGYASGYRLDVDRLVRLARARGARVMLDAIQGLGVFPLDVHRTEVDFLAADGHKWLLGPEGAGVFYVRRSRLEELDAVMAGWNSVEGRFDFAHPRFELRPEAARWEIGSQNAAGMIGLGASLDLLLQFGLGPRDDRLARRVLQLTGLLCDRLESEVGARVSSCRQGQAASGIVSFHLPGVASEQARDRLLERRVVLSCRAGQLRAALHAYNDASDIDRLVEGLAALQ